MLKSWDVVNDSYVIADGSGLSRYNYVTSEALVRILQRMRAAPSMRRYSPARFRLQVEMVPCRGGLTGTPAEGRVRAKTGTVDNVRAIAGYVETAGGETLVFSMIANNFMTSTSAIDAAADKALSCSQDFRGSVRLAVVPPLGGPGHC